ncbi:hypothetical protein EXIGLDRAFT_262513 [Exidia glandulosa HHB12029]|uniref:MFS general substrate transporter n=1 Tax=Exidia glandulosa HHB12029 TaxID=1314781 RepID=A0A165DT44_EXIGL|nr:hypothetical protein EXIGLDRAFT_262513 [Exidia glandulosa HHB12029]
MEPPGPDATNDDVLPDGEHGRQPSISRTLARPSIVWALPIFAISSFVSALRTVAALAIYLRLDPDYLHINPNAVHESIVQTFLDGADVNSASLAHMWFLLSLPASVGWLTHAWWGQRADAWGRTVVLAISAAAATSTGINILLVSYIRPSRFDLWLLPGAMLEGLFGGAGVSASLAYLSDCSPAHHRAAVFSINSGLSVAAYGLGARPGPLPTHPAVLLCVSIAWNVIAAGLWAIVVPESLLQDVRAAKRAEPIIHWPSAQRRLLVYLALPLECVRALVRPLGILRPRLKDEAHPTQGRDWSVFYLAGAALLVYVGRYAATIFLWLLRLRHFHDRQVS